MTFLPRLQSFFKPGRIHLDYASTTPVSREVVEAMRPFWEASFANPSAVYREGVEARRAVESARKSVAATLHVRSADVVFTSGGTESNNLATIGLIESLHESGRSYDDMEIVTTTIEHTSILEPIAHLRRRGVGVTYVSPRENGLVQPRDIENALTKRTVLVALSYVNSEVGVIQDVKAVSRLVRAWNEGKGSVRIHLDASQAPLWLPCAIDMLGVDFMTLDAGKCYGPKGVGVLARKHGTPLSSLIHGGGQEGGLRSGTENVPLIVGCATAITSAQEGWEARAGTVREIRDHLFALIARTLPFAVVNGHLKHRVANNVNISLPGFDAEYAVMWLDARGIACSTKSACGVHGKNGSSVVREMTRDEDRARSTIRFTLGERTTRAEVEKAIDLLKQFTEGAGAKV